MANSRRCESSERQKSSLPALWGDPIIVQVLDGLSCEPPHPTPIHPPTLSSLIISSMPTFLHKASITTMTHVYSHSNTHSLSHTHTNTHTHTQASVGWERQSQTQVVHSCMMGMDWCSCLLVQWSSELELLSGTQWSVERSRPQQQSTRRNSLRMSLLRRV